jgi:hypothetical protein
LGHTLTIDSIGHQFPVRFTLSTLWRRSKIIARPNENNRANPVRFSRIGLRSEVPLLIDGLNLNYKRIGSTQPDTITSYDWVAFQFPDPSIVFFNEEINTAKAGKK